MIQRNIWLPWINDLSFEVFNISSVVSLKCNFFFTNDVEHWRNVLRTIKKSQLYLTAPINWLNAKSFQLNFETQMMWLKVMAAITISWRSSKDHRRSIERLNKNENLKTNIFISSSIYWSVVVAIVYILPSNAWGK
jgi:hypothetical protein